MTRFALSCAIVLAGSCTSLAQQPVCSAFTFQGRLSNEGKLYQGPAHLVFELFAEEAGGTPLGVVSLPDHPLSNGFCTATLDFGAKPFAADRALWLAVTVNETAMKQRMRLNAAPFSVATRGIDVAADGAVTLRHPLRVTVEGGDALTLEAKLPARQSPVSLAFARMGTVVKRISLAGNDDIQIVQGDGSNDSPPNRVFMTLETTSGELSLAKTRVPSLQITGGADLAERFDVCADDARPGMVVTIDADCPGRLRLSDAEYDPRVAGVVSGAGGVRPGMVMGQTGSAADGAHPVALSGRAYVLCDAAYGPIRAGDRLTTSPTRGHAMSARDATRTAGAVIGKAMGELNEGTGLVLMLVQPQ